MTIHRHPRRGPLAGLFAVIMFSLAAAWGPRAPLAAQADRNTVVDPALYQDLRFRSIGPHRGGRVTAVAGVRRQPFTFYMGATGGGVWKTTDAGHSWVNVSDGFFATASIGAIAVSESNPDIVYVGTGSAAIRSNVILGKGVYKSTDAGRTWTHVGLAGVGQIGSVKVNPRNPDVVFVAALGQPFGPSPDRGVFRTTDGGRTWKKTLFINDRTGAVSLSMNPSNPDEIYAGAWRGERKPWTIISGGPAGEGGLYKTTDGGETWTHLTRGLPRDLIGKTGVDLAPSNPARVYAILEAPGAEAGVYRSDDAGATWRQVSSQPSLIARPFYYTYITVDPRNADIVYVNNLSFWKSTDGGRAWRSLPTPHGDNHGLWINPDNPDVFIQSNDGGANVTLDGGQSWSSQLNQDTAEIYAVAVDEQFPYRVYGAQQDTGWTVIVPSLPPSGVSFDSPLQTWTEGPGCETGPVMPRPGDPTIVYGSCKGEFTRMNMRVGQEQQRWVHPENRYGHAARDLRYRFQRVSPMEISPADPKVIYYGSQFVHRTRDEGLTWEVISPDLTAHEADKQGISGEPITRDITGEEMYSTLYAIRESALEPGVIWTGSNDGPVHVTRDNGRTWKNVTPKDLPPGGRVQNIEPSPHRKGSAYVAVYRYLLDDWRPYLYATDDYGATWRRLTDGTNGIPADDPTRVVREDPRRAGLLYAGTEFGLFVSFDNGAHWQSLQQNLPVTPVTDIRVHHDDLVLSTMGRGFFIMDDVLPLGDAAVTAGARGAAAGRPSGLATLRPAWRMRYNPMGSRPDEPTYPPPGAYIDYFLAREAAGPVTVEILDAKGVVVRTFSSEAPARAAAPSRAESADEEYPRRASAPVRLSTAPGMHRFQWDLRAASAPGESGRGPAGPLVVPGTYQVRLKVGGGVDTKPLDVKLDPRVAADGVTIADLQEQFDLLRRIQSVSADARETAANIARAIETRAGGGGSSAAIASLEALRAKLVTSGGSYPQPMLIDQLSNLARMAGSADQKVGRSAFEYLEELERRLSAIRTEAAKLGVEIG
jgi:photosystem II stability/assembly factor-like uncharacterized protein